MSLQAGVPQCDVVKYLTGHAPKNYTKTEKFIEDHNITFQI